MAHLDREVNPDMVLFPEEHNLPLLETIPTPAQPQGHFSLTDNPSLFDDLARELALPRSQRRQPISNHLTNLRLRTLLRQRRQGDDRTYDALIAYDDNMHALRCNSNNRDDLSVEEVHDYVDVLD
jgi:hypothetical protein